MALQVIKTISLSLPKCLNFYMTTKQFYNSNQICISQNAIIKSFTFNLLVSSISGLLHVFYTNIINSFDNRLGNSLYRVMFMLLVLFFWSIVEVGVGNNRVLDNEFYLFILCVCAKGF